MSNFIFKMMFLKILFLGQKLKWPPAKHNFLLQFFFDGVITIGSMLDIAVFYLAQNPEMQERAYEEIQVKS